LSFIGGKDKLTAAPRKPPKTTDNLVRERTNDEWVITNDPEWRDESEFLASPPFEFGSCSLFRISSFEFRISSVIPPLTNARKTDSL
jgi:hypothetical protein